MNTKREGATAVVMNDWAMGREQITAIFDRHGGGLLPRWRDEMEGGQHDGDVVAVLTADHDVGQERIDEWRAAWPGLEAISCAFTGVDRVDVKHCEALGIHVTNVPRYAEIDVAELVVGLALSVLRRIPFGDRTARDGRWDLPGVLSPGTRLKGRTVGIVGTGTIGQCSAERFAAMGCPVIGWNRSPRDAFARVGRYYEELDELLREADIVALHLPATKETRGIIDARRLGLMKPTSILINAARAELVDTTALAEALKARRIAGAGIDVFEGDPIVGQETAARDPLLGLDPECTGLVVCPHLGFKTHEALERLAEVAVQNLGCFVKGNPSNQLVAS